MGSPKISPEKPASPPSTVTPPSLSAKQVSVFSKIASIAAKAWHSVTTFGKYVYNVPKELWKKWKDSHPVDHPKGGISVGGTVKEKGIPVQKPVGGTGVTPDVSIGSPEGGISVEGTAQEKGIPVQNPVGRTGVEPEVPISPGELYSLTEGNVKDLRALGFRIPNRWPPYQPTTMTEAEFFTILIANNSHPPFVCSKKPKALSSEEKTFLQKYQAYLTQQFSLQIPQGEQSTWLERGAMQGGKHLFRIHFEDPAQSQLAAIGMVSYDAFLKGSSHKDPSLPKYDPFGFQSSFEDCEVNLREQCRGLFSSRRLDGRELLPVNAKDRSIGAQMKEIGRLIRQERIGMPVGFQEGPDQRWFVIDDISARQITYRDPREGMIYTRNLNDFLKENGNITQVVYFNSDLQ